jgi:hypothetical protein
MVVKNYVNIPFACEMEPRILLPVRLRYVGSSDILRVLWLQSEWKLESPLLELQYMSIHSFLHTGSSQHLL